MINAPNLSSRLWRRCAVMLAASVWLAGPVAAKTDSEQKQLPSVVFCWDRVRDLVTHRLPVECDGEIISRERADAIEKRRQDQLRRAAQMPRFRPTGSARRRSLGTGFFVSSRGIVITNNHVVRTCSVITVQTTAGQRSDATVIGRDKATDLALLATGLVPPAVGTFLPNLGRDIGRIATVGYPTRLLPPLQPRLTVGVAVQSRQVDDGRILVPVRAEVRPGNSGGPLVDGRGLVAGVIVAKVNTLKIYQETGRIVRDIGFAIRVERALEMMRKFGVKPQISDRGVTLSDADLFAKTRRYVTRISCWQ